MSAIDLINRFGRPVTVTTYAAGAYSGPEYVSGAATTFTTIMSIQPLNGKELMQLSEAQRTRQIVKAYSSVEVKTASQSTSNKADLVTDENGTVYEVQASQPWVSGINTLAPHWKLLMAELNPG